MGRLPLFALSSIHGTVAVGHRLKPFLALSRTFQATLSIAQPGLGAVLAVGGLPSFDKTVLGIVAAWAGLHAVFAMNDLLDVDLDRRRFQRLRSYSGFDIDAALVRHPLAQGMMSRRAAAAWVAGLGLVSLVASFMLSPISAVLFLITVLLQWWYCKLAQVSAWKFVPTGIMIGLGSAAGWFAVTSAVNATLIAFFLWMSAWEIAGRNIINDWSDIEEDVHLGIKTVPATFGLGLAGRIATVALILTFALSLVLGFTAGLGWVYGVGAALVGLYTLLLPGARLLRSPQRAELASILFNRASFYPPAMLLLVLGSQYLSRLTA